MPNVHFELTAEEERLVRAMVGAKRATEGSKEEAKKLAAELRGVAQRMDDVGAKGKAGGKASAEGFAAMSAKILAITGAAALAHKAVQIFLEDADRLAKEATQSIDNMISAISGAGDLGQLSQVRGMIMGAKAPGLGIQQRIGLYKAIRGEAPTAELPEVMQMFEQAARGAQMGMSDQDIQEFGQTIASLRKLGIGDTVKQTANVAKIATEAFGKRGAQFLQTGVGALAKYRAAGGDPMEGLAVMLSMMEAGLPAEQMTSLVEQTAGLKPVKPQMELAPKAKARLADIDRERQTIETRREEIRRTIWESERRSDEQQLAEESMTIPERQRRRGEREAAMSKLRADTDAEMETMRRREFELSREQEQLREQRAPRALTKEEAILNRLAGMTFAERMQTLLQDPEAARAISPQIALRAAPAGAAYQKIHGMLQAGMRPALLDYIGLRIGQTMTDEAAATRWHTRVSQAGSELLEEQMYGQAARQREEARAMTRESSLQRGEGPVARWFYEQFEKAAGAYDIYYGQKPGTTQPARREPIPVEVTNQPRVNPLGGGQEVRNRGNE